MSGAGRGTPRVSPFQGFGPQSRPQADVEVFERVAFQQKGSFGIFSRTLTTDWESFSGDPSPIFLNRGILRFRVQLGYIEGAAGGAVEIYPRFDARAYVQPVQLTGTTGSFAQYDAKAPTLIISDSNDLNETSNSSFNVTFPVPPMDDEAILLTFNAREVGVPATPGTLSILAYAADTLTHSTTNEVTP